MATINLIYDKAQKIEAEAISDWMLQKNIGVILTNEEGLVTFDAKIGIAASSAIVFVCDEATDNKKWHEFIHGLSDDIRIIPVGEISDNDRLAAIPANVSEINFIRIDEHLAANILDSLTTSPDFYSRKNRLQAQMEQWHYSGCADNYLAMDVRKVKADKNFFADKLRDEQDSYLRIRLERIIEYLDKSLPAAKKTRNKRIRRYLSRAALVALAALAILLGRFAVQTHNRGAIGYLSTTHTQQVVAPDVEAIRMLWVLDNNLYADSPAIKNMAFNRLVASFDTKWPFTTLGVNFEPYIRDFIFAQRNDYVWVCCHDGSVAYINRISGKPEQKSQVGDQPLDAIASNASESIFIVSDVYGQLYINTQGGLGNWDKLGQQLEFTPTKILIASDSNTLLAYDDNHYIIASVADGKQLIAKQHEMIYSASANPSPTPGTDSNTTASTDAGKNTGFSILYSEEHDIYIIDFYNNTLSQPILTSMQISRCASLYAGRYCAYLDNQQRLCYFDRDNPESNTTLGVQLQAGIDVVLLNQNTLAYLDRNVGIRLFNISERIDLGSILVCSTFPVANKLVATTDRLGGYANGSVATQDINQYLPLAEMPKTNNDVYTGIEGTEDFTVSLFDETLIEITVGNSGERATLVVDLCGYEDNVKLTNPVKVNALREHINQLDETDELYWYNIDTPSAGKPTLVAIEPSSDFSIIYIGTADGMFVVCRADVNGYHVIAKRQMPSHLAIQAFTHDDNRFFIQDAKGLVWEEYINPMLTSFSILISEIQLKSRSAYSAELIEMDSVLAKVLELLELPGSDGTSWGYEQ